MIVVELSSVSQLFDFLNNQINLTHTEPAAEWTLWPINGFNYSIKALRRHREQAGVLEELSLCASV